jgi:ADP-ribose pyrophosphatase YjhB (NUDIX family)
MNPAYEQYCNNCGKNGHGYVNCKIPIISIGIICFRQMAVLEPPPGMESTELNRSIQQYEYLMIRRKDTLGYIDFMRGKYSVYNKNYIMNMLKQMTVSEKEELKTGNFDKLWIQIWGLGHKLTTQYKAEESVSRDKFNLLRSGVLVKNDFYTLTSLIEDSSQYSEWTEAEWGFPKGRRNYQEKDLECALREFSEETGYSTTTLQNIQNIVPFEETFLGSNYKSYKHKYYLMHMNMEDSLVNVAFEKSEVSKMEWKTYEQCMSDIRSYNVEKKRVISNVNNTLLNFYLV